MGIRYAIQMIFWTKWKQEQLKRAEKCFELAVRANNNNHLLTYLFWFELGMYELDSVFI